MRLTPKKIGKMWHAVDSSGKSYFSSMSKANVLDFIKRWDGDE